MGSTRYASVLGLAFGDCGKGHFVHTLARRWKAHTVVRFNGGAQAGHNVVDSSDPDLPRRHHTFSQFSAGTLAPGVHTALLDPMIVHPTALLVEAEALARIGVHDALARLKIDAQCRLTTPYHQAAGRLRERLRGVAAHGTCGVGVGETVRHALAQPEQVLRYAHLAPGSAAEAAAQMDKLQAIRETLLAEFFPQCAIGSAGAATDEFKTLLDETVAGNWMTVARALARQCPPESTATLARLLTQPGCVLFEGAQGALLDEWRGFHPHTTWSSISTAAVELVAARFEITAPIEHYGAMRCYLTRHGIGPLPTHDEALDHALHEPYNRADGWQGPFRRGHPDAVLLRYGLEVVGQLSGLLVSHLDIFERGVHLKWCDRYAKTSPPAILERLPLGQAGDLTHQQMLANLLMTVQPLYDVEPVRSAQAFLGHVSQVTHLPVILRSFGIQVDDVREG